MVRSPQDVTDAELTVLQILWDRGPSTIRDVTNIAYPDESVDQYSTVKRLLVRLETKGFVRRDEQGPLLVFRAAVDRSDLIGRRLEKLSKTLCGGSISPLLVALVQAKELTRSQRKVLVDLIEELDQKAKK